MNVGSIIVLAGVLALAGWAVWRNIRKGAPCSCGCECGGCPGNCKCGKSH